MRIFLSIKEKAEIVSMPLRSLTPVLCLATRIALVLVCVGFSGANTTLQAQVDTVFWFAAPDWSVGHGDQPIYFRFTTLNQPATITLSQPANPGFVPIQFAVPANASYSIDMTPYKGQVENDAPNAVLDRGVLIRSDALVNVYYENASFYNPDIFPLKGRNALGRAFVIPMQDLFQNGNYNPVPYASFNIVATQNNTTITITPKHDIVGHPAGETFTVTLNRGQTFVARALRTTAGQHLGGSIVDSDKPIAITISDDSMAAAPVYGGCADLGGDQITSVDVLGTRYITVPGALNGPNDIAFVYGVTDGTSVTINGTLVGTIDRGEFLRQHSFGAPMLIETDKPVYVLHMSGFGCEVGLNQMPFIDPCNGSRILSINRSSNQALFVNILVYRGLLDDFLFNGRSDVITAGDFQEVNGTDGDWHYASVQVPLATLAVGQAALIENTAGPFHLAVIHGGVRTGTMYGYFSDYGRLDALPDLVESCPMGTRLDLKEAYVTYRWGSGDTTSYLDVTSSGWYYVTVTNEFGCEAADSVFVAVQSEAIGEVQMDLCPGDSVNVAGEWFGEARASDTVFLQGQARLGCDSMVLVELDFYPPAVERVTGELCFGDSLLVGGEWWDASRPSGQVVLRGASFRGCDSLIEVELEILPQTQEFLPVHLCRGESWSLGGEVFHENRQQGQVRLQGANRYGCDSLVDVELRFYPEALGVVDPVICRSDTLWVQNTAFHADHMRDTLLLPGASSRGCDSFTVVRLGIFPEKREEVRLQVCPEDTIVYLGERFYRGKESGELVLRGADVNGCDSTVAVVAEVYPEAHGAVTDTLCPGERLQAGGEWFSESRSEGYLVLRDASQYGCDSSLEVSVFYPQNNLQLPEVYETLYGKEIQLRPWYWNAFGHWSWTPGRGLSCTDCERPWADGIESGSYRLVGTDLFGCEYEANTRVIVRKERKVFIPNAITVNGDGVNDRFTAFGNYFVDRIEFVEIFDRWGNLIIRIEDIPHSLPWWGWDGTHRGQGVLPGAYVYRLGVRYLDGEREVFYGDVTVIR